MFVPLIAYNTDGGAFQWIVAPLMWALRTLFPFAVLAGVWELVVLIQLFPRHFFPPPSDVLAAGVQMALDGSLLLATRITIERLLEGASIGLGLGVLLAIAFAWLPRGWRYLRPSINYFEAMGEIGWLPVFVLWAGYGEPAIIATVAYTVVFPVLFSTLRAFHSAPASLMDSVRTLGGNRLDVLSNVLLPAAMPGIITGLRAGMGFAWRTVILAEFLIARRGLGVVIFAARTLSQVDVIMAGMIVIGILWLASDQLILKRLEARTVERWGTQTR
jgi:taurine transport system permease protein